MFGFFGSDGSNVDAHKFEELLSQGYKIIDVRTPEEFNQARIEGAVLMNIYNPTFKSEVDALKKDEKYAIYCASGSRSASALSVFRKAGITEVCHLAGGIISWYRAGKPLVN